MDKQAFTRKLEEAIQETEALIAEYRDMNNPVAPDNAIGRVSRMDAINNKSITDAALRNAKEKLQRLQYARDNMDHPNFGKCKKCGNEIPEGRLLLKPESPYCVNCA